MALLVLLVAQRAGVAGDFRIEMTSREPAL
jgi:hypothetical protein